MGGAKRYPSHGLEVTTNNRGAGMRKFLVENLSDQPVKVAIEPWADLEVLAPGGRVVFEYEEREVPAEIEFSITGNGRIVVGIVSDLIKITGSSGEKIFTC
jgi:hypothetical protein